MHQVRWFAFVSMVVVVVACVLGAAASMISGCSSPASAPDIVNEPCTLLRDVFVDRGAALGDEPAAANAYVCPWPTSTAAIDAGAFDACLARIEAATTLDELEYHATQSCAP